MKRREEPVFQGADGLIVGLDGSAEVRPGVAERLQHVEDPRVQLSPLVGDLPRGKRGGSRRAREAGGLLLLGQLFDSQPVSKPRLGLLEELLDVVVH